MTHLKYLVVVFLSTFSICAQQNYWQQKVDYKIQVELNDEKHEVYGFESFNYSNNSSDTLFFIYIHLWPNAYKNEKTPLGKQLWEKNNQILRYGGNKKRGFIDSLDFKVNEEHVKVDFEEVDICKLILNNPLLPNQSLEVSTPFRVKIPSGEISRMGHIGQSYQLTQWYPKPAVYDKNGWNQISYLNQGEFYSEFGTFDVKIKVPSNYVVGATGDLQNKEENEFLDSLVEVTNLRFKNGEYAKNFFETPISSKSFKILHYRQENVHDFAWFADKSYQVQKGEVELPHTGKIVTTWAMFTPNNALMWQNSIEYLNDGTYYYSLWNGDYPYNHVTAVDGTISAGGGMEYPNITVIGDVYSIRALEVVIVHEVGHNWFYGILGSNERVHGWMDEGLNSFNEDRYFMTKYPNNTDLSDNVSGNVFHFENLNYHDNSDFAFNIMMMLGEDQPIETHSRCFSGLNYGFVMYKKSSLVFHYLKSYLGDEVFDECMREYYTSWHYKHPGPLDLKDIFERVSGKSLDWLFKDLIQTTNHLDYKIKRIKSNEEELTVKVKNKGQVNGPIPFSLVRGDSILKTYWLEDTNKLTFPKIDFDKIIVDYYKQIPEINRQNNEWKKKGLFHKFEPLKFDYLLGQNDRSKSNLFWTPIVTGNLYDRTSLGLLLHNYTIPIPRLSFVMMPSYSFNKRKIRGFSDLNYLFLPKAKLKTLKLGVSIQSFGNKSYVFGMNSSSYFNVSPYVFSKIGNRKYSSRYNHSLLIRGAFNNNFDRSLIDQNKKEIGGFIKFSSKYTSADHRANLIFRNDYIQGENISGKLGRFSAACNYSYRYAKNEYKSWIYFRAYFGTNYLFQESELDPNRYQISLGGMNGLQDFFYENIYFARTSNSGSWSNQQISGMGDFKTNSNLILSQYWLGTFNTYFQLPAKLNFIGVFCDYGLVKQNDKSLLSLVNTGLGIRLADYFGIYFPLYNSLGTSSFYKSYHQNIRLTLKLNIINEGFRLPNL